MFFGVMYSPVEVLPEPDPNTAAIASLQQDAVLSQLVEVGPWVKITTIRPIPEIHGWVRRDQLIQYDALLEPKVQLLPEPFGQGNAITATHIRRLIELPGWWKIQLVGADRSILTGWMASPASTLERAIVASSIPAKTPIHSSSNSPFNTSSEAKPAPIVIQGQESDLALGINTVYSEALLRASRASKIDASALAALVDAEAGRIQSGPEKGLWNSRAFNSSSGAAGLTQFLASTWIGHAAIAGTALGIAAKERSFIMPSGEVAEGQRDALLDLRFDPLLSICSAAEYGDMNLKGLVASGLVDAAEHDDRKAWFMYLAHHEGLAGAKGFLRGDKVYSVKNLVTQVGNAATTKLIEQYRDANAAYRGWLTNYINKKIKPQRFRIGPTPPEEKLQNVVGKSTVMSSYATLDGETIDRLRSEKVTPFAFTLIGSDVSLARAVQKALSFHGYLDPPADGEFGPVSLWAIEAFVRHHRLDETAGFTPALASLLADSKSGLPTVQKGGTWMDGVVQAMVSREYFVCRHPECCNIVYVEGIGPDGTLNDDRPNRFNDCRIVFKIGSDGIPTYKSWDATSEPGDHFTNNPLNSGGAARIALGQHKAWAIGPHPRNSLSSHEALVQVKPLSVHRDFNRDHQRTADKIDRGLFGLNQHWGYDADPNDIKNTSAGCLVGRTRAGHREFMATIKEDARYRSNNAYRFVTTILAGDRLT